MVDEKDISCVVLNVSNVAPEMLHPVVSSNGCTTTWTRVHNIFASINTKWNQATSQPKPKISNIIGYKK